MRRLAALLVSVALLAGCTAGPAATTPSGPAATTSAAASPTPPSTVAAPAPASPGPTASKRPTAVECAAAVVQKMSPAERAGQLVMVGVTNASAAELAVLREQKIGSVIIMGQHPGGVSGAKKLTARLSLKGRRTPLLIAVDQEGGLVQRLTGPGLDRMPSARTQGTWSDATLKSRAARWGRQLAAGGVNWTLAPVADVVPKSMVNRNAPIGRLNRGFGSDPDEVADKVTAFVEGMQSAGVATSAKHFPGLGQVVGNTDFTTRVLDTETTADDQLLEPFRAAVEAGGDSIMVSTVFYTAIDPDHRAVYSPTVLGLLRDTLGFGGVIISDDLGSARSLSWLAPHRRGVRFIRAGGDLAITVDPWLADEFVAGISQAADDSAKVADQVRAAATRVVALKVKLGLVACR